MRMFGAAIGIVLLVVVTFPLPASPGSGGEITEDFDRELCSFTSVGHNRYFPLRPGYTALFSGSEEDEGKTVEVALRRSVLPQIEVIDGVRTRPTSHVPRPTHPGPDCYLYS